ncbi:MAG: MarR family transcriptional regulator [Actinomycetota bacterium]
MAERPEFKPSRRRSSRHTQIVVPVAADVDRNFGAPSWRRIESTLMLTSRALRRAYDDGRQPTGLNQSEASVSALLGEELSLSQSSVAQRIGMRRAAAGAIIKKLDDLGYVQRAEDPRDRRAMSLVLSDAAQPILARITQIDTEMQRKLRSGLSREERRQLALTLDRIRANLDQISIELARRARAEIPDTGAGAELTEPDP